MISIAASYALSIPEILLKKSLFSPLQISTIFKKVSLGQPHSNLYPFSTKKSTLILQTSSSCSIFLKCCQSFTLKDTSFRMRLVIFIQTITAMQLCSYLETQMISQREWSFNALNRSNITYYGTVRSGIYPLIAFSIIQSISFLIFLILGLPQNFRRDYPQSSFLISYLARILSSFCSQILIRFSLNFSDAI